MEQNDDSIANFFVPAEPNLLSLLSFFRVSFVLLLAFIVTDQ